MKIVKVFKVMSFVSVVCVGFIALLGTYYLFENYFISIPACFIAQFLYSYLDRWLYKKAGLI